MPGFLYSSPLTPQGASLEMHMSEQVGRLSPKHREQGKWQRDTENLPYRKKLNHHSLSKLCILYKPKCSVFKSLGGINVEYIKCLKSLS